MKAFIERTNLLDLILSSGVRGIESPTEALMREPAELLPVSAPALSPLDLDAYRVRRDRWQSGVGPSLTNVEAFMEVLESPSEPVCVVTARGQTTTYVCLLNETRTRAVAVLAIDGPRTDWKQPAG